MNSAVLSLIILLAVTIVMLTGKFPITTTALAGAFLCCALGMHSFTSIFKELGSTTMVLIFGLSIIGTAMFKTGLARAFSLFILRFTGKTERGVMSGIMLVAMILSMLCSNMAVVVMLIPIVKSISKETNLSLKHTMFPLCMGAAFGGGITLVGTTSNIAGNAVLEQAGLPTMGMFTLACVGIPMAVLGMLWMCTVGHRFLPKAEAGYSGEANEILAVSEAGDKKKMLLTAVIVLVTVIAMCVSTTLLFVSCLLGSVLLILTGCITEKDAYQHIEWRMAILIVSFSVIAGSISNTGGDQLIAKAFSSVIGTNASPIFVCAGMFLLAAIMTNFMSNQVTVMTLAPIAITIAETIGANPRAMVLTVVLAANACFATPVGAPPFTLVMDVADYKYSDYVRMGLPLVLLNFVLAVVIIPLVWSF